ncbi:metallophosphoesterase [Bacteroides sp.]
MYRKLFFILIFFLTGNLLQAENEEPEFLFSCQPYLQQLSDTEVTIVWGTNKDAVSWVEIAPDDSRNFYAAERPKFFDTNFGRKKIGTLHKIHITGLSPATKYRYRIYSKEVTRKEHRDVRYGRVIANNIHKGKPYVFSTLNPDKREIHFAVVNDIHENIGRYAKLFHAVDSASLDFMLLNGDMVNKMDSVEQMYRGFINTSSELFAKSLPFYMVRGNHETRGNCSEEYINLFPSPTQQPYYSFAYGPVCFIVLDGGEDKPDSDIEYNDLADFDKYRTEQVEWLKKVVVSEEYKKAAVHIVLIHVPPFGKTWHGILEVQSKFIPVLNEADVHLMLSGHIHRHEYYASGQSVCKFPLLINSNRHILDVKVADREIYIDMIDEKGIVEKQFTFSTDK